MDQNEPKTENEKWVEEKEIERERERGQIKKQKTIEVSVQNLCGHDELL